jgi:GNAT superfamily N-acetyltransferase
MNPQIVRLIKDELQHVRNIAHGTWPSTFKNILSSAQIQYMLNWMYDLETLLQQYQNGQQFYAIKENEKFLGFAVIELNHPKEGKCKLHKLYVLPDQQGKGYGKLLLDCVVETAIGEKMQGLILNVNRYNTSVNFYKHYGFTILKEEVIDIGNGFIMDDYIMALDL